MLDQAITPLQEIAQPAEAGFSTNMFLNHPMMGRVQFTFRGATARDWGMVMEDVGRFLHYMKDKGWNFDGYAAAKPAEAPQTPQPPDPNEPQYTNVDDSGSELPPVKSFVAERLSVKMEDGKYFYKVMGGQFNQWGISVWPEVLEACRINVTDPASPPSINGWTAEYTEIQKDGKTRRKVTRLLPPK